MTATRIIDGNSLTAAQAREGAGYSIADISITSTTITAIPIDVDMVNISISSAFQIIIPTGYDGQKLTIRMSTADPTYNGSLYNVIAGGLFSTTLPNMTVTHPQILQMDVSYSTSLGWLVVFLGAGYDPSQSATFDVAGFIPVAAALKQNNSVGFFQIQDTLAHIQTAITSSSLYLYSDYISAVYTTVAGSITVTAAQAAHNSAVVAKLDGQITVSIVG